MSAIFTAPDEMFESSRDKQLAQLRIPPHSQEAESSVLGGLLLDNNSWDKIADILVEADFYRYEHRLVFSSIMLWLMLTDQQMSLQFSSKCKAKVRPMKLVV